MITLDGSVRRLERLRLLVDDAKSTVGSGGNPTPCLRRRFSPWPTWAAGWLPWLAMVASGGATRGP